MIKLRIKHRGKFVCYLHIPHHLSFEIEMLNWCFCSSRGRINVVDATSIARVKKRRRKSIIALVALLDFSEIFLPQSGYSKIFDRLNLIHFFSDEVSYQNEFALQPLCSACHLARASDLFPYSI